MTKAAKVAIKRRETVKTFCVVEGSLHLQQIQDTVPESHKGQGVGKNKGHCHCNTRQAHQGIFGGIVVEDQSTGGTTKGQETHTLKAEIESANEVQTTL
jgi:hypothetical protein